MRRRRKEKKVKLNGMGKDFVCERKLLSSSFFNFLLFIDTVNCDVKNGRVRRERLLLILKERTSNRICRFIVCSPLTPVFTGLGIFPFALLFLTHFIQINDFRI